MVFFSRISTLFKSIYIFSNFTPPNLNGKLQMRFSALWTASCTNALSAMNVMSRVINRQDALQEHVIYFTPERC
jgi:hypothetical protein